MSELLRLRGDHADAVLAFERANRAYFARSITDRGDAFYERFTEHHRAMVDEQDTGTCVFHVLVADDGEILGSFNLRELSDGGAEVGYRVAEGVAGCGVATEALQELCHLSADRYGLHRLIARTRDENVASRRVLEKAGFLPVGAVSVAGAPGTRYERAV